MSKKMKAKLAISSRAFLIVVVLLNAIIPTVTLAKPNAENNSAESLPSPRELPNPAPVYYEPKPLPSDPLQFALEDDDEESLTPEKDAVEFVISTDKGEVEGKRTISINVLIRNHANSALTNLNYYDKLEGNFSYQKSSNTPVTYNLISDTVTYKIETLNVGEEISFTYMLKLDTKKNNKISIHNAEIEYELNKGLLAQTASLALADNSSMVESDALLLIPDQTQDGWETTGRYSLYLNDEVLTEEAVVAITPTDISGAGPELQFQVEFIQSSTPTLVGNELNEQDLNLIKTIEPELKSSAYLEVNLDGYIDLTNIPAGQEPYVATYDEENNVWVKVPIVEEDASTNSVTVAAAHFSTWGVGLGNSLPQNGANVLLFDQPYTSLFTGAARYSVPIWSPPGRTGMAPQVALSYSSATVDGVLGDVQAPWTGVGWSIDGIEIVRKITTNENGYGYVNDFALTLNGAVYSLVWDEDIPNRYYTDHDAFLYIERHNYMNGNAKLGDQFPINTTGEWWEVVTTDGTRYRLGWNKDSEQLALMYGYKCTANGTNCNSPDGAYKSLEYAGLATDLVALRWRVDKIQDTHGNYISYTYKETSPTAGSTIAPFDKESYLDTISYTGFEDKTNAINNLLPAYHIHFDYSTRIGTGDIPSTFNIWDNVDSQLLNKIEVCYQTCSGNNIVRTYDLGYTVAPVPNNNGTLTLTQIEVTGNNAGIETQSPTIRFNYENKDNRAVSGSENKFTYPRLVSIDNGAGGLLTYTYENDGRTINSWYNYRVKEVKVQSNLSTAALQSYDYVTPVYTGSGGNTTLGDLIGYTTVTENQLDYNSSNANILSTIHTFGTNGLDTGRELKTEWKKDATVYRKVTNVYVTDNTQAPFDKWNFRYLYSSLNYELINGSLSLTTKSIYKKDPATGNLLSNIQYLGASVYRKTFYEYVTNPNPSVYILDKVSRVVLTDATNITYSDTRYFYDEKITQPELSVGELTLTQVLTGQGNQTVDRSMTYDEYGNIKTTTTYKEYGTVNSVSRPLIPYTATTQYDSTVHTYPITNTNALLQSTSVEYLLGLGLPKQVTDPNGWVSTTTYDGLGRTLSATASGLTQPGVYYTYPTVNDVSGRLIPPYNVEMQILDTLVNQYRSVWGFYDGLGRLIQTQVYDADQNQTLVTDSYFNSQGLAWKQTLPYYSTSVSGYYISPNTSAQFTQTAFDFFGRPISITQPGNITSTTTYDGLTSTTLDPKDQKISRTTDGLGRLINVKEYSTASAVYATTTYFYDAADRLTRVQDAKGNESTIQYDWLGRKTGMDDPDMGVWSYEYYSLGTLKKQTDARNESLNFTYDALGRLLTKTGNGVNTVFEYGTQLGEIGMRKSMADSSGSTTWNYNNYGRMVVENRQIGGVTKTMTTHTDWLGRPISVIYPDAETLTYQYDALGRPKQLNSNQQSSLVTLAYTSLGQIDLTTLGNGVVINNEYNSANRLQSRSAYKDTTVLLNFGYIYDNVGNITQITDNVLLETHEYQYDFLNRLTSAKAYTSTNPTNYKYNQQFTYDQVGNMLQMNDWITGAQAYQEPEPFVDALTTFRSVSSGSYLAMPVLQSGFLFEDGFESGDFSAWSSASTDGGDLSVSTQAAAVGNYGMQALIDDTANIQVNSNNASPQSHYRVRFYFDPNSINIPNNDEGFYIFTADADPNSWAFCLKMERRGVGYTLRACVVDDSNVWVYGQEINISDNWQAVEMEWQAASAPAANDGSLKLWINDILVDTLANLDTDTLPITDIKLGVLSTIPVGISGTVYFDAFVATNGQSIGLDPNTTVLNLPASGTVNIGSYDDAEESATGVMSYSSNDLELVRDGTDQLVGVRFTGVSVPQGATILNAYVQFTTDEIHSEATALTIQAEAVDHSPELSMATISSRLRTTASTAWSPAAWLTLNEAGLDQRTPDLSTVIQELVNRPGWKPSMAMTLIITGTGKRVAFSDDGTGYTEPRLVIEYTTSPVPTTTPVVTETTTPTVTPSIYTFTLQPNDIDGIDAGIVSSSSPTSNYGTNDDMGVGENNNSTNKIARSLIKFDLSALPANAIITSATLSLWTSQDVSSTDRTIQVYRLKVPFNESQATWNISATGVNWQTAGAAGVNDREAISIGSTQILNNEPLNTEKQIVLNASKMQELINGSFTNNGFIIIADTELDDRFNYKTSDSTSATQRPKLVIQYTLSDLTPTPSLTPTTTPTSTATVTNTLTKTFVPTNTGMPSPIPTATPTSTVTATPTPSIMQQWNFDTTTQSWQALQHISSFAWQNGGYVGGNITGIDPIIYSTSSLGINIIANKHIVIRYKNTTSTTTAQFFFITNADTTWDGPKSKTFMVLPNSDYTEYIIDMSTVSGWTGTLNQLRFDPAGSSGSFSIDYIRIGSYYLTPTYTVTASKTFTPTNTLTPSRTPTPYTVSPTPTKTLTPSNTPTITLTSTSTPHLGNLLSYWNFDNTSGTVPDEAIGDVTNNSATLYNGALIEATGFNGKSIFLDGTNDYASITDQAEIRNNGSFTISAWVNPSALVTNRTQYLVNKSGDYGLLTITRPGTATPTPTASPVTNYVNGSIAFEVGGTIAKKLIGPVLPVNTWTLVTGVYDASANEMRLYLNGELVAAQNVTGSLTMGTNPLTFSSSTTANVYHGRLDEVRFYNRAITTNEVVLALYEYFYTTATPTASFTSTTIPATNTPNTTPTPMPISQQQWGTGADLDLIVNSTINLNTYQSTGRTCADAVAYNVTLLASTSASLNTTPGTGCLNVNDEILLVQLLDSSPNTNNAGNFEFLRVNSINGNTITFTTQKTKWYGNGWRSDSNIGIGTGQIRVMLMRVPNYANVTINSAGKITSNAYDGYKYGVVAFRVAGTLSGSGNISGDGIGGAGYGKGSNASSAAGSAANGGGGSHQTAGNGGAGSGERGGIGSTLLYGEVTLTKLFSGSAGGNSTTWWTDPCGLPNKCWEHSGDPASGGAGGGIVLVIANNISFSGTISSNGANGLSMPENLYGGAGSGGSVRIEGNVINLNAVTVNGGSLPPAPSGVGGKGRIAIYYQTSQSISSISNTPYIALLGQAPTPKPITTPINLTPIPLTNWGDGRDGNLIVGTGITYNISVNNNGTHTCNLGDGAYYKLIELHESWAKLSVAPQVGCLTAGDEILLLHAYGSGVNAGNYEFLRVGGVVGDVVYFTTGKLNYYGASANNDDNIGTDSGKQSVIIQRVPNYQNVTINGALTTNNLLVFRVAGMLSGAGAILANGTGLGGYGKGGNAATTPGGITNGGGGGYGTVGSVGNGSRGGAAGTTYGEITLTKLFSGSGGGNSTTWWTDPCGLPNKCWESSGEPASGGQGGGIVLVIANNISFSGTISSNGANGPSMPENLYGGAGSGGSVRIEGNVISNLNAVTVNGGSSVPAPSGAGGQGRIAIYYYTSLTTSLTSNSYTLLQQLNPYATLTPTATISSTPTTTPTTFATTNVALNKPTTADSSCNSNETPAKAVNGSWVGGQSDKWCSLAATKWLQIDLGSLYMVNQFVLYHAGAGGESATTNTKVFNIQISTDGSNWSTVVDVNSNTANTSTHTITSTTVRYVKLNVTQAEQSGNYAARIYEMMVYGAPYIPYTPSRTPTSTPTPLPTSEWIQKTYTYSSTIPHAVSSVTDNQTPLGTYTYDANGNMTCRIEGGVTFKQVYNTENRISSIMKIAEGTCDNLIKISTKWDYAYDGDGVRTSTLTTPYDASGNPLTASLSAYYFGGAYETRSNGSIFKYYSLGGQSIVNEYKPATSTWTLSYMLTDHLGSVVAITNTSGALVSQQRYLPFGGIRNNIANGPIATTDYGYTGQRNLDSGIGLMDYKFRFYSPTLNRFISPDTVTPGGPQGLNRFSYVGNNPIKYNDPTGHVICEADGSFCFDPKMKSKSGNIVGNGCNGCWSPPKPPKEENSPLVCSSRACDPNVVTIMESLDLLPDFDYQSTCNMFLSGAPLLCNTDTISSSTSYYGNIFNGQNLSPAQLFSMFSDMSNERGWLPFTIPGRYGYGLDFLEQRSKDLGSYGATELHLRAHVVALEGQASSFVSLTVSGFSAIGTAELGPGVVIVMGTVYIATNMALSSTWDGLNEAFVFPAINSVSNYVDGR